MPTLSAIQLQLKRHEQWLIDLRQDSCMTLAKVQTELESQKRVGSSWRYTSEIWDSARTSQEPNGSECSAL
ncbi:hypothetical protein FJTKL_01377 [Diaporthe vaccinii]|uniref:Uncharacterized protein n=1 Tax=Diaporthe vaccinii TaxID=105482 RepID=A0ABR4E0Z7_9PEZI